MSYGTVVSDAIVTLRQWLQSSNPKPGERVPSERRLMSELGLTHNAVNRAMTRLIAEGVVRREGYKLYYGEERAEPARLTCDLVVARRSYFIRGYRKTAKALGIDLRLHYYESVDESMAHLQRLNSRGTESVLFDPPHTLAAETWAPAMRRLIAHDIPAISIGQQAEGVFCVLGDFARAVRLVYRHLRELGHAEMALFTVPPRASTSAEIHEAWQALPWEKTGRASSRRIAFYEDAREDVQALAQRLGGEWKNVTALVVHSVYEPIVPHLIDELARQKKQVPRDLSIIALGDLPHLATSVPSISAATVDFQILHETAFRLLQRLTREKQRTGLLSPAACLGVYPGLAVRESTRSLRGEVARGKDAGGAEAGEPPPDSRQALRAMLKRPYPLTLTAAPERFASVDISPFVNRSLNYRKGWFGDLPLAHFEAGRHRIHGVPFDVLGGARRTDNGVIIFRSRTNERGNARELPSRVRIPVDSKATAVYILHGCGYTRFMSPFADYAFYSGARKIGEVKMVALGRPPHDWSPAQIERDAKKANIQDWWGDFPHVDFPGTRQAPIVPPDDATIIQRYAYLYTLEWRNPHPQRKLTHIEVSVDAGQSTTLGLIALTVLR